MRTNLFFIKISLLLILLGGCNSIEQKTINPQQIVDPPMEFRSVSFQIEPDSSMMKRAADLGFNTMIVQTEGSTRKGLEQLRQLEDQKGYFQYAAQLGMKSGVWMREISDYDGDPDDLTIDNEEYWKSIEEKYTFYLTELLPEIDYLVFTLVESEKSIADSPILFRMVETVNNVCKKHGKTMILHSFVHDVNELETVKEKLDQMPDDIMVMTKYVEHDWRMRGPNHQLIGKTGNKKQIIELDAVGENFRLTYLANCYTDDYFERYMYWLENEADGINIRVSRHPQEGAWWEPLKFRHLVYAQPNEVIIWTLGYLAAGYSTDIDKPWKDFCEYYFNEQVATEMEKILRVQGEMVAEALNVLKEPFGNGRLQIPGEWTMNGEHCKCRETQAVVYEDEDDMLYRNPFHHKNSVHRWHPSFKFDYHQIRKGHPRIIKRASEQLMSQITISNYSLKQFYSLKEQIDPKVYEFYKFKLEENNWFLRVMNHVTLSWLKAAQIIYFPERDHNQLKEDINMHLENLKTLHLETDQKLLMNWYGKNINIARGEYIDIPEYIEMFTHYWQWDDKQ
ncbi:MAG: hypothetical protein ACOCYO_07040 [Bacteroidota bacterium]